jgi:hypothetical protein
MTYRATTRLGRTPRQRDFDITSILTRGKATLPNRGDASSVDSILQLQGGSSCIVCTPTLLISVHNCLCGAGAQGTFGDEPQSVREAWPGLL